MSGPMVPLPNDQAFGGRFITSSSADTGTASWSFAIPTADDYVVWCRVLAVSQSNGTFYVRADNGSEDVYDVAEGTWGPNWQWTRVNGRGASGVPLTVNPRKFTFSAGTHTFRLRERDPLTRVDRVIVTNDFAFVPTEGNVNAFADTWPSNPFYEFVENLARNQITTGCGGGKYCPASSVTRAQMAVMLLKSKHGSSYVPPPATGTVFSDVPKTAFAAAWIEQLSDESVTTGCGGGRYCPDATVTRAQMAVFLLRAANPVGWAPPAPTGLFADISLTDPFTPWIEQLSVQGVTAGCGGGNYCPNSPNTRGQMAAFLVRTFHLQ